MSLVDQIAATLRSTARVPLPWGHGAHFLDLVPDCGRVDGAGGRDTSAPGAAERAFVCLALLGRSLEEREAGEKVDRSSHRNWSHWALQWLVHFEPGWQSGRVATLDDLLDALSLVAASLEREKVLRKWVAKARRPLAGAPETARVVSAPHAKCTRARAPDLAKVLRLDEVARRAWHAAAQALAGEGRAALLTAFFLNTVHAELGVPALATDLPYGTEREDDGYRNGVFFEDLMNLLRSAGVSPTASRVSCMVPGVDPLPLVRTLKALVAVNGRADGTVRLESLTRDLPRCFQRATLDTATVDIAQVTLALQAAGAADDAVADVRRLHRLARVTADRLLDPLRVRLIQASEADGVAIAGFGRATYRRLENTLGGLLRRGLPPPERSPMSHRYLRVLAGTSQSDVTDTLVSRMQRVLAEVYPPRGLAPGGARSLACALCRLPMPEQGTTP